MSFIKTLLSFIWRCVVSFVDGPSRYVKAKLKYHGLVRFNHTVTIKDGSTFEGVNTLSDGCWFSGSMGYGSFVMRNSSIIGSIGRFCSIGELTKNVQGIHPLSAPFVTTCPMFYSLKKQTGVTFANKQKFDEMRPPVNIGNDCWVGDRVYIVGGITIGDGAAVMSGAVVTKDVPPYAIVGGVPAKIIKYRYDEDTIKFLLETKWWDKPIDWLKENWELLCDIDKLKFELSKDI